jgi:lipid-A-disaccharide synthase
LVTSGTATLETALFKVPQVVLYRTSALSYQIAKNLIQKNLQYISLVNLVAGKKIVEELIQNDCDTPQIKKALSDILAPPLRNQIFEDYHQLEELLGGEGASERVAKIISQSIGS